MEHIMNLNPNPMKMIKSGEKTIELRLYDEKRKNISIGDTIKFINTDNNEDIIKVYVKNIYVYDSFKTLYKNLPLQKCGYTQENINTASPKDMEEYYSLEKQNKYGVVGIEIEVI